MKPRLSDSPTKLAVLSALGGPIACALPLLPGPLNHSWLFGPCLLFCIVVTPVCAILPFKFVTDLRHGVEDERWTEAQLEPLRALLQSRYYTALCVGLFVAFVIFEFALKRAPLDWEGPAFSSLKSSSTSFALPSSAHPHPLPPINGATLPPFIPTTRATADTP